MKSNAALVVCLGLVVGCGEASTPAVSPAPSAAAQHSGGPPAPVPPPPVAPPTAAAPTASMPSPQSAPAAAPAPGVTQQKASADLTKSGVAGKGIGRGILATPAGTYLRIADKPIFQSIEHAMNLYKAEHGALPKTHDDFMRDIIQANNVKLPELPDDSKYLYLPEQEELMIERTPM